MTIPHEHHKTLLLYTRGTASRLMKITTWIIHMCAIQSTEVHQTCITRKERSVTKNQLLHRTDHPITADCLTAVALIVLMRWSVRFHQQQRCRPPSQLCCSQCSVKSTPTTSLGASMWLSAVASENGWGVKILTKSFSHSNLYRYFFLLSCNDLHLKDEE